MKQKGQTGILILVGVLIIALVAGGAYYFRTRKTPVQTQNPVITSTPQPSPSDETVNWQIYTNNEAKFSIKYPIDWNVNVKSYADYQRLTLNGKEGTILIDWGNGFGGACPQGYEKLILGNQEINACHNVNTNGTETWSLSISPQNSINYGGFVTVKSPYRQNRQIVLKILSTFEFTDQNQTVNTSLCQKDQSDINTLINTFEVSQIKKDALGVLALFTPPTSSQDISTYNFFLGKDVGGNIRLYNSAGLNINETSYIITGIPVENPNGCTIQAQEQTSHQPWKVSFDVVKQGNTWLIDKYYQTGQTATKYSAWGQGY